MSKYPTFGDDTSSLREGKNARNTLRFFIVSCNRLPGANWRVCLVVNVSTDRGIKLRRTLETPRDVGSRYGSKVKDGVTQWEAN